MKDRESEPADDAHIMEDTGSGSVGGDAVISVECGLNKAVLHLYKLCQGSKGACIMFDDAWMTPNEFQAASGRETAKDWKRSIKHHDKSIKLLMIKGFFSTDPAVCSCNCCTGIDPPPFPPPPPTISVTGEERRKKVPEGDDDNANGVTRQQSKNGRKQRTKSKAPVAEQLRKRKTTTSRRSSERSSPITSARTVAKVGRRRATFAASGATHAVSDNEAEKSDTEVDDDDNTEQESSSDGADESLTLADVKKGLDVKGKHALTSPGTEDGAPTNVDSAKSKCDRKEKPKRIHETALDIDVSSVDTLVIKTNIANSAEEKKACETKCTELVHEGATSESRITHVDADNDEKTANVPSVKLTTESLALDAGGVQCEATLSDESTSLAGDESDSPILETDAEKGAHVENGTESNTQTSSVDVSCHEDDVSASKETLSAQLEANYADKSPSAIGCCALEEEQVIGTAAAAPQANKTTEENEPVNGKTADEPLAAMPTGDDVTSAIDTEDECAHGDADLPGEERNNEAAPAELTEQTQTDDDTKQDVADAASSENLVETLSPKREARLRCIIQELKTYKQRLVTTIEAKKRTSFADHFPMDDDETLTRSSNSCTDGCPPSTDAFHEVMPDCPSLDSPPASSSPLQQLLFEPTVHPVSFVAKHLSETTCHVPGKRKRHGNRCHVSDLIFREGLLTPTSTTLNHEVKCNGDQTSTGTYCLGLPTMVDEATEAEKFAVTPNKLPWCPVVRSYGIADSVASDKYLLKVPRRCGADVVSGAASERSATVALLDLSAQKRKSSEKLPDVSQKKQRVSWPTAAPSDVNHFVYRGASSSASNSLVTSVSRVPSLSALSLCDGRRAGRSRSDPHSAPLSKTLAANYGSKSTRRPHISSWSADDVFAFVLSTPHASIYAKEFMEHRITGRVLQNMTAIQMMRILRIGELAAKAVRATVEQRLEMTSALAQRVRR